MKTYTVEVNGKKYEVGVQRGNNGTYRFMIDGKQYTLSQGEGQLTRQINITIPEQSQPQPIFNIPAPVVNITMPEQPAPVVHVAAPVVNMPKQERQAPPQVTVNVPQQAAPIVRVEPAAVNVTIPDIKIVAGSVAKVKRDYTGRITEVVSNAQATSQS